MSIKSLSFQEIKKKADKLRELFQKFLQGHGHPLEALFSKMSLLH